MSGRFATTKSEAAEQLGVSVRTLERLISAGRLQLVHVEGAARVRVADLGAYVQGLDADSRTDDWRNLLRAFCLRISETAGYAVSVPATIVDAVEAGDADQAVKVLRAT